MRYKTGINATRTFAPSVAINTNPDVDHPAEVHVDFGGMSAWFSEEEATELGRNLIEAGIRIRTDRTNGSES